MNTTANLLQPLTIAMSTPPAMNNVTIFWLQLLLSLGVCVLVAVWYVWPSLTKLSRNSALIPLLFVHVPRYVGMTLLVTGMIDPKLPREFLTSAAYGDLLEAALALASIFALRSNWRLAVPLVASVWQGSRVGIRFSPANAGDGIAHTDRFGPFANVIRELNRFCFVETF